MVHPTPQLRHESASAPAFLMIQKPPNVHEMRQRLAEWIVAAWMNGLDPNVMGVRRVDEEKNGAVVPTIHIAIPLGYRRKQLAGTLSIVQIEDEQNTPRVNLISSVGSSEAHSYIRVPAEVIFSQLVTALEFQLLASNEINDETIQVPEEAIEHFVRDSKQKDRDEHSRLKSAIQQALAMKNAVLSRDQIQLLYHKQTREKWIRIKDVPRSIRTTITLAIWQAGIRTKATPDDGDRAGDWAVMFLLSEANKLLVE